MSKKHNEVSSKKANKKHSFKLIDAISSGLQKMKEGERTRYTPFTKDHVRIGKNTPHVNSVRKKLTEYFYMNLALKDFELHLDEVGLVQDIEKKKSGTDVSKDIKEIKEMLTKLTKEVK